MRFVFAFVRAFIWTINHCCRVYIRLGSSYRVFLGRALTGLHLDLRALFSQQVGPYGDFFACASCLGWLGLSFELLTVLIGVILDSGAHIACFSGGRWRGSIWTCATYFLNKSGTRKVFFMRFVFGLVRAFVCTVNRSYRVNIGLGSSLACFSCGRWQLTGPHLDLRALFFQQVWP